MPLPKIPYDDWFHNPLDDMPIATNNPRPEEEVADWFDTAPCSMEPQDEEETIHEKMYKIATDKYNPFSIGGSESIHDFD